MNDTVAKIPKSHTSYTYDTYGLTKVVEAIELNSSGDKAANTYPLKHTYTYNTSSSSKIFGTLSSVAESGGKGGGRPDSAMSGGRDASMIDAALAKVRELLAK